MAKLLSFFFILLSSIVCFYPQPVFADIHHYKINTKYSRIPSFLFVDFFSFIENLGRFQLNVTDIHFSNPNPNDLSQIGFFLARVNPKYYGMYYGITCALHSSNVSDKIVYTFDNLRQDGANNITTFFNHTFVDINRTDLYALYFQNCGNDDLTVSMDVRYAMYNLNAKSSREGGGERRPSYLWPTQVYSMTRVYPIFSLIYLFLAFLWLYILYSNKPITKPPVILLLFSFVLVFKAWSLIFQVLHDYYILHNGCSQCWPSILLNFTSEFFSEATLLTFILLVSTGWSIIKPKLHQDDRLLVMTVIIMNLFFNAMKIVADQKPPTDEMFSYETSPSFVFLLVNCVYGIPLALALCSTEAFLRKNENPSVFLKYSMLFGSISVHYGTYNMLKLLCDVTLAIATTPYTVLGVVLHELVALLYYVYIGYKLRSEVNKEKLLTFNEDIEKATTEMLGFEENETEE
ncbi:Lung seven transmembrane receptor family protein [Thalictrum thalictroides]|uniref:Lung seven transmembrane receptor family protein n=1 Tax=Thalictrum thalictroides TaxID=46969 RepID=A0A7J6WC49_THATH|nr:Lung seven transmembrane receptor family protein [Thalictrum thalictroides]